MSWRRSKSNAQQVRDLHRRREVMRRAEDGRIALLAQSRRAGAR